MTRRFLAFFLTVLLMLTTLSLWAGDSIPKAAWKRPLGQPLTNPGGRKPNLTDMIDDGYWQGAPVGGFGAGTLSRTYRGDFARWQPGPFILSRQLDTWQNVTDAPSRQGNPQRQKHPLTD